MDFKAIDLVYEPSFDNYIPVICSFSPTTYLAYKSYVGKFEKGKEEIRNLTVRQCHYCWHYFAKSKEKMEQNLSICGAKEDITYSFNNSQIMTITKTITSTSVTYHLQFTLILKQLLAVQFFLTQKCLSLVSVWYFHLTRC